ncbi:MAG: 50S ribosomal protein L9 [Proteobacteria bacterium]|nr:50S ribosomal protein L9 [Pseudomonadota bacterium]
MKLILRADVDALGRLGDIVAVKPGFGRNFLIPQGLAMMASEANLKQFELERKKLAGMADSLRSEATELAAKIAAAKVSITVRVGEGDKLYGSVTAVNIADALLAQGIEIDRRKIDMPDAIRSLGEYDVEIRLHPDVKGELKLRVIKHGQPEKEPELEQPEA